MQKRVHITYIAISTHFLFVHCYQHQVLKLMCLGTVLILLPYWFTWVNETWNSALKTPLPKTKFLWNGVNFVMSDFQYIIVLRATLKIQIRKYYCWHGVNKFIPSVRYIFIRKSMRKIQMNKYILWNGDTLKKSSQWYRSVTNLLLTGRWNCCNQKSQMAYALTQYIAINKINFECKLYKLCGLLGAIN